MPSLGPQKPTHSTGYFSTLTGPSLVEGPPMPLFLISQLSYEVCPDSTEAIEKHWHKYFNIWPTGLEWFYPILLMGHRLGAEMGVDANVILATSHGRRSIDVLRMYDPSKANWEYISYIEGLIPKEFGQDAVEIPGGRALWADLENIGAPWAVVTSGTRALIEGWLEVMKLPHPRHLVVAEDVEHGKPDPACYILGRSRLDLPASSSMMVIEDAPSGVRAGKAAGCKVVGLATTHDVQEVKKAGADWIVRDLRSLKFKKWEKETGLVEIEIKDILCD